MTQTRLCWPRLYRCGYRCQECVELIPMIWYAFLSCLSSALNPLLCPLCWKKVLVFAHSSQGPFLSTLCPVAPDLWPVPVCLADCEPLLVLVVSASRCPHTDYPPLLSRRASDFFCCTSLFSVIVFCNPPSCSGTRVHLCSKGHDLHLEGALL